MGRGSRKASWRRKDLSLALRDVWAFNRRMGDGESEEERGVCVVWVAGLFYGEVFVSLDNFQLSHGRVMSHGKYTDQLKTGLQIQLCDFREGNHFRLGCGLQK